jgi:D,D-heptose 1,7-bisphosphate phosphatase
MKNKIDLVILTGGKGTRLKNLTKNTPKPLLKINRIVFLRYIINFYSKYDFENIFLLSGFKGLKIKKIFHNKRSNLIPIKCYIEKKKMDTGGALNILRNKIKNNFILLNGDSFLDFDLQKIFKLKFKNKVGQMILIKNKTYKTNNKLSELGLNKFKTVVYNNKSKLMNSGVYYFKKKIFNYIKNKPCSLETNILPKLILSKKIGGIFANNYFIDIGTKKNLILAQKEFKKRFYKPAIFLDRDGVINEDKGHVYKIENLVYRKNIFKTLSNLEKYYIFIVTNQAGIAKGYYSEDDFINFQKKMKNDFLKKRIFINDVKFCPHHPDGKIKKYKKKCKCRKPLNGMFVEILNEWPVNTKKSIMIGDKFSDKEAVKKIRIPFKFAKKDIAIQLKKFKV